MDPTINKSNQFIHKVMTQAIKAIDSPAIPQLSGSQREVLLKIIHNTDNIIQNYETGKDKALDDHLASIHITLQGVTNREESLFANFSRGFKTGLGLRTSAEELKNSLINPYSPYRQHLIIHTDTYLPTGLQESSHLLKNLPQELKNSLDHLIWCHFDLGSEHASLGNRLGTTPFQNLIKAHTTLNLNIAKSDLNEPTKAYLKEIANHFLREHVTLDFSSITSPSPLTLDQMASIPEETAKLINTLMWAHTDLAEKNVPADTETGDPVYRPFQDAANELGVHLDSLKDDPGIPVDILEGTRRWLLALDMTNLQRPFLSVSNVDAVQLGREERKLARHLEETGNNPALAIEHEWVKEGFVTPIANFNLWEKTTLTQATETSYILKIQTKVNTTEASLLQESRERQILIDLNPFQPKDDGEKKLLLDFLAKDTPYNEEKLEPALNKLSFLNKDQKKLLVERHKALYSDVTEALKYVYRR